MTDGGHAIKYGLQISTDREGTKVPEGTGVLMTAVTEGADGIVNVHTKAEGFEASQDGAEAIRDLFRDMADAIDRELGNAVPDAQTRRGTEGPDETNDGVPKRQFNPVPVVYQDAKAEGSRCRQCGKLIKTAHHKCEIDPTLKKDARKRPMPMKAGSMNSYVDDDRITRCRACGEPTETVHTQCLGKPFGSMMSKERAESRRRALEAREARPDHPRKPMGLAAHRERRARKHD